MGPTNNSDHLPMQLKCSIKVSESSPKKETYDRHKSFAKLNWTNDEKKKKYAKQIGNHIIKQFAENNKLQTLQIIGGDLTNASME